MALELNGTTVFGKQSRNLDPVQSRSTDAKQNPVPAPTSRAQNSGTGPPPKRLATYSYSSFAPSSLQDSLTCLHSSLHLPDLHELTEQKPAEMPAGRHFIKLHQAMRPARFDSLIEPDE